MYDYLILLRFDVCWLWRGTGEVVGVRLLPLGLFVFVSLRVYRSRYSMEVDMCRSGGLKRALPKVPVR